MAHCTITANVDMMSSLIFSIAVEFLKHTKQKIAKLQVYFYALAPEPSHSLTSGAYI